ncbi:hypothetical protein BDN70DRAFT_925310 [Pholiota conissans]|uniref:Uncharacterized protein n=1 Tax=Pholiota conissans TaxID=109636 RepID=A0A9P6CV23_9AGAR|nr:hypothetical protein BDN70DRAFT_925310 [Pholiota conissans]
MGWTEGGADRDGSEEDGVQMKEETKKEVKRGVRVRRGTRTRREMRPGIHDLATGWLRDECYRTPSSISPSLPASHHLSPPSFYGSSVKQRGVRLEHKVVVSVGRGRIIREPKSPLLILLFSFCPHSHHHAASDFTSATTRRPDTQFQYATVPDEATLCTVLDPHSLMLEEPFSLTI